MSDQIDPQKPASPKKNRGGRPETFLTPEQRAAYVRLLAEGMGRVSASGAMKVSYHMVRRTIRRYEAFAREVAEAESVPEETCLSVIFLKVVETQDIAAAKAYLDTKMKMRAMTQARADRRAAMRQQSELVERVTSEGITPANTTRAAVLLDEFRRKMQAEAEAQVNPLEAAPQAAG